MGLLKFGLLKIGLLELYDKTKKEDNYVSKQIQPTYSLNMDKKYLIFMKKKILLRFHLYIS
jgi:hypothetical protein